MYHKSAVVMEFAQNGMWLDYFQHRNNINFYKIWMMRHWTISEMDQSVAWWDPFNQNDLTKIGAYMYLITSMVLCGM